ncbi:ScbR family autoregulator-binding transcription factor [Streptomyces sp. NPDC059629]|uniref:ScbR family autoregulator-binding transcription factor n=1 Tax=Streptomyces sp. NPDC059629 TaxID=3346889 RepID=UPI00369F6807
MGHQQERATRTRRLMLKSAAEVFDREGYASARLADISAHARMSTGALHFHFANKEDLARTVVNEARGILWRAALISYEKNGEPLQSLVDISHTLAQLLSWDVVARSGFRLDTEWPRGGRQQFIHAWHACLRRLLDRAEERGTLREQIQPQPLTCAIVAATTGMGVLIKGRTGEQTRGAFTGFWQGFLPGLAAPHVLGELNPGGTTDLVDYAVTASRYLPYEPAEAAGVETAAKGPL